MPYQSIFSGGQNLGVKNPGAYQSIVSGFVPGKNNASPSPVNVGSIKDVPTLNAALKAGHINKTQWVQQFKQIQTAVQPTPKIDTSIKGNLNPFNHGSALGAALNKVLVQAPVAVAKSIPQSEAVVAKGIARLGPNGLADVNATQQQATAANKVVQQAIADQKAGRISPTVADAIIQRAAGNASQASKQQAGNLKSMPTRGQLAAGFAGTAADVLTAGTLKAAKTGVMASKAVTKGAQSAAFAADAALGTGAAGGTKKQIAINAAVGGALPEVGTAVSKLKQVFKDGPQQLLRNATTSRLVDAGREANKPVNIPVSDVTGGRVQSVDVRTPVRPTVQGVSTADKITVRTPQPMTDQQFKKEFNGLSKSYDRDTKQLEAASTTLPPKQVQALSDALDTKYQTKLNDLQDRYNNPPLSTPVAPKAMKVPREPAAPRTTASSRTTGGSTTTVTVTKTEPAVKTSTTVTPAVDRPITESGTKVAGSALKSEARAVEQHLTNEFQDKAEYSAGSYRQEAEKATKLANEDQGRAMDIAMGRKPGDNTIHEVAVARAVENKALKEGDIQTLQQLATSSRHSATSEAAQRLGSEGYNADPHSPVQAMAAINRERAKVFEKRAGTTVEKAVQKDVKVYSKVAPTKNDWESFVKGLACK